MKNEAEWAAEWIEYHLLVGVEKFWLIENDGQDNITAVLFPYMACGIVHFSRWHGKAQQIPIYNAFLPALRSLSYWVAVIDLDEYMVPVATRSIPEILSKLEGYPGITMNWVYYGSNGQQKKEKGLVIERFRNHTDWDYSMNRHTKTIVNPRMVSSFVIHDHNYFHGQRSRDATGRWNGVPMFDRPMVRDILRINHYGTKSREEYIGKRRRGRASVGTHEIAYWVNRVDRDLAEAVDAISNDTAILWAIPIVKERLALRSQRSAEPDCSQFIAPFLA
jgi:hypothetical protein